MSEKRRINFIQSEQTDSQSNFNPQDFRFKNDISRKFVGATEEVGDKNLNDSLFILAKNVVGKLARHNKDGADNEHDTIKQEEVDEYAQNLLDFCLELKQKHGNEKEAFVVESLFLGNIYLAYNKRNEFGFEHLFPNSKLNPVFDENNKPTQKFNEFSGDVDIAVRRLIAGIIESIKKILNSPEGEKYRSQGVDEIFFTEQFPTFFFPNTPQKSRGLDGNYFVKKRNHESISRIFFEERQELFEKFEEDSKNGKLPYFVRPPKIIGREQDSLISAEQKMSDLVILCTAAAEKVKEGKYMGIDEAITVVTILSDFVKACQYIKEKGFILGDIKPDNIGYDTETKQGFAFDFDAVMKPGEYYPTRLIDVMAAENYNFNANPKAHPGEAVHQLGQVLDMVFGELYDTTNDKELKNIFSRIIKFGEDLRKDYDRRLNKIKFGRILAEFREIVFELKDLKAGQSVS